MTLLVIIIVIKVFKSFLGPINFEISSNTYEEHLKHFAESGVENHKIPLIESYLKSNSGLKRKFPSSETVTRNPEKTSTISSKCGYDVS